MHRNSIFGIKPGVNPEQRENPCKYVPCPGFALHCRDASEMQVETDLTGEIAHSAVCRSPRDQRWGNRWRHVHSALALLPICLLNRALYSISIRSSMSSTAVLFKTATVIEGDDDSQPYVADVLVESGIIKAIGPDLKAEGARVVRADNHVLCPGFIDLHAHSDLYLLTHPDHEPKISQGCTVSLIQPRPS